MKFKAIIFDLDGTLVNSLEDIANSMNGVLQKRNLQVHETENYKTFIGNGLRNLVSTTLPEAQRDDAVIQLCLDEMLAHYSENCLVKTQLYEGIPALLDELVKRGIKLAIFSNKKDELTKKIAAQLLNKWPFEVVVGMTTEERRKPSPEVPIEIANKLGLQPGEIIFAGDSGVDMQTAVNSGMYAAGVTWGFRTAEELTKNGADVLIHYPADFFNIL